jgi:hypothetical protein
MKTQVCLFFLSFHIHIYLLSLYLILVTW